MNSIVSMNHSPNHPDNKNYRSLPLTRREELLVELRVVQGAIENAEKFPDLVSAGFLDKHKKRETEILAELKKLDEKEANK